MNIRLLMKIMKLCFVTVMLCTSVSGVFGGSYTNELIWMDKKAFNEVRVYTAVAKRLEGEEILDAKFGILIVPNGKFVGEPTRFEGHGFGNLWRVGLDAKTEKEVTEPLLIPIHPGEIVTVINHQYAVVINQDFSDISALFKSKKLDSQSAAFKSRIKRFIDVKRITKK